MKNLLNFILVLFSFHQCFATESNKNEAMPVFVVNIGRSLMPKTDCKTNCGPLMMRIRFSQSEYEVTDVSVVHLRETWKPKLVREDDVIRGWSGPKWNCDSAVTVKIEIQNKKTGAKKLVNEPTAVKCSH